MPTSPPAPALRIRPGTERVARPVRPSRRRDGRPAVRPSTERSSSPPLHDGVISMSHWLDLNA